MKKNILPALMPFLFFITVDVQAEKKWIVDNSLPPENKSSVADTNFYAKVFGGVNFLANTTIEDNKTSYNAGYVVSGSLGYAGHYGLRPEFEYAFRRNKIDKMRFVGDGSSDEGHFQTSSYMANLLWDMPLSWKFNPFIGAGIGYDFQQMFASNSRIEFSQQWNKFSWQAMAGFVYPLSRRVDFTVEYKFHQGGHFYNNALGIGFVFKFGYLK